MSNKHRVLPGNLSCAAALLTAAFTVACSTSHDTDESGRMMNSGIAEARSGLAKTQSGVDQLNSGDRAAGAANIDSSALDQAQASMKCMGHRDGMMGMM